MLVNAMPCARFPSVIGIAFISQAELKRLRLVRDLEYIWLRYENIKDAGMCSIDRSKNQLTPPTICFTLCANFSDMRTTYPMAGTAALHSDARHHG
jgi:hypothetical protein